jgi:hypothetical protein
VLQRYNTLESERENILRGVSTAQDDLNSKMATAQSSLDHYEGRTRNLTQAEIELANKAEKTGTELANGMHQAISANEKAGQSFVGLESKISKSNASLGRAARALLS